jgi:hypothetical protein
MVKGEWQMVKGFTRFPAGPTIHHLPFTVHL